MYIISIIAILSSLTLAQPVIPRQSSNLQPFTGALGGATATPVTNSGNADRPFQVKGDTFVNIAAALQRSCDQQFNACADLANAGGQTFTVGDCQTQESVYAIRKDAKADPSDQCTTADQGATATSSTAGTVTTSAAAAASTTVTCG